MISLKITAIQQQFNFIIYELFIILIHEFNIKEEKANLFNFSFRYFSYKAKKSTIYSNATL